VQTLLLYTRLTKSNTLTFFSLQLCVSIAPPAHHRSSSHSSSCPIPRRYMGFFCARWFTKVAVPTSPHQHSHNRNASQKPLNICVNVNIPTHQPSLDPFRYRHSIRHSSVFSPHTSFSPPSRIPHPPPDPSALPHYSASSILSSLSDRLPHPPHPPNRLFLCHPLPLLIPVTPPSHLQHISSTSNAPSPPPPLHPSLPEYHIPYTTQPTLRPNPHHLFRPRLTLQASHETRALSTPCPSPPSHYARYRLRGKCPVQQEGCCRLETVRV